ncbi:MAG: hypothetical protein HY791_29300 [Deltaproteobacteria bacterium]|nr:hypothetical protein [Deltaproteobacteria bacterium]
MNLWLMITFGVAAVAILLGVGTMVAKFFMKVEQGKALLINKLKDEPEVTFTGGLVFPVIHRAEVMDISVKTITIDRRGKDGLICSDNIRADITVTFFVRVNKTREDVLKVAQMVGCTRASDQKTVEDLFLAKFAEALKTVGKQLEFESLYKERDHFKDKMLEIIGKDLNGYVLDDAAIDYLEQTPIEMLDKDNILDARGIRKITELTVEQNVKTNELRNSEKKEMKAQNVSAQEAILELDRRQSDAEAKQKREIATIRAREEAMTKSVQAEEMQKSELSRVKAEEEIAIADEARNRQVAVARKNRERIVAIETERVEKDRMLEVINRERETELMKISKEKEVEAQKKEIADIIRSRIAVDKTVAEEEERIKDTRAIAEAKRQKEVVVTTAEAEAREHLIKEVVAAEAAQEVAKFRAKERLTLAEAELEASDKTAKAKIRLAEGVQAETAASGLAKVRVREADAVAFEKEGQAQARVKLGLLQTEAQGIEQHGLAQARADEAKAVALEKLGLADAVVVREKLLAEAKGEEEKGLVHARVTEADAAARAKVGEAEAFAREKLGLAEAVAIRERMMAEAAGLVEKANALNALEGEARVHEEFRIRLEKDKTVQLAEVDARKSMAKDQAEVMRNAFEHAKINIVGGDGQFFERFVNAVSLGKAIDGAMDSSESLSTAFKDYATGKASLAADLKQILSRPALGADTLRDLSVSAVLSQLAVGADGVNKSKLKALLERAKELGLTEPSEK